MCFGEAALNELQKCVTTLRSTGSDLPVVVFGDKATVTSASERFGTELLDVMEWKGEDPYDDSKALNFQFRSGRVKPYLYDLSPFRKSMYVDCDVEFMASPEKGFGFLKGWDFVVAQERLMLGNIHGKLGAGWQRNILEQNATIEDFGGDGNIPFWNSGILF